MENDLEEIKLYSDYKSPYAYLAFDPGFALEGKISGARSLGPVPAPH